MAQFIVYGTVTFRGACVIVEAETIEEAKEFVNSGETGDEGWDIVGAELVNWNAVTAEPNE